MWFIYIEDSRLDPTKFKRWPRFSNCLYRGKPACVQKITRSFIDEDLLVNRLTLVHGLVGQLDGEEKIVQKPFHAMNRVGIVAKLKERDVFVPYSNLTSQLAEIPEIVLLKCDIEGSELALWKVALSSLPRYAMP